MAQVTRQNCKHVRLHLTSTMAKGLLQQRGRWFELGCRRQCPSTFWTVDECLSRRTSFNHAASCSNSVVSFSNVSFSSSSPVPNASFIVDVCSVRRISSAVARSSLPRGTRCKWPSKPILCSLFCQPSRSCGSNRGPRNIAAYCSLHKASSAMWTYPSARQCFAITAAERFSPPSPPRPAKFSLNLDFAHSQPLGSDFHLASTCMPHQCASFHQSPVRGGCAETHTHTSQQAE